MNSKAVIHLLLLQVPSNYKLYSEYPPLHLPGCSISTAPGYLHYFRVPRVEMTNLSASTVQQDIGTRESSSKIISSDTV